MENYPSNSHKSRLAAEKDIQKPEEKRVAGKVINGFSGYGASLYVPQSRLEEAQELLQAQPVEDEETEQHA